MNYDALFIGLGFVMVGLFVMAWLGMQAPPRYTSGRPPKHPLGWNNRKRGK